MKENADTANPNRLLRIWPAWALRACVLFGQFSLVGMFAGCTTNGDPMPDACQNADCADGQECAVIDDIATCLTPCETAADCEDDGDACTIEICDAETSACAREAMACEDGRFCTGGVCVECGTSQDCDNGLFCDGEETCNNGACENGPPPCASDTETCDEDNNLCLMIPECSNDDDCTDEDLCTLESCVEGTCASAALDCIPDFFCDPATGSCIECLANDDCDDGLFCNGIETCDTESNACLEGAEPCSSCNPCYELDDGFECLSFHVDWPPLTAGCDNVTLGRCSDTLNASREVSGGVLFQTLNSCDILDGGEGYDTINAELISGVTYPAIVRFEVLNLSAATTESVTLDATHVTGVTNIRTSYGWATVSVIELAAIVDIGVWRSETGITVAFRASATETTMDATTLYLSEVTGGTVTLKTGAANGIETLNIISYGSDFNTLTAIVQDVGTTLHTIDITGAQGLEIQDPIDSTMPNLHTVNGADASGALTLTFSSLALTIIGGSGDDTITGGAGNDTITGGAGSDTLVFSEGRSNGFDTITDFAGAGLGDVLDVDGLGLVRRISGTTTTVVEIMTSDQVPAATSTVLVIDDALFAGTDEDASQAEQKAAIVTALAALADLNGGIAARDRLLFVIDTTQGNPQLWWFDDIDGTAGVSGADVLILVGSLQGMNISGLIADDFQ